MQTEIENVINKIKHLCDKTTSNGCTEAEALAAATKVGELLQIYNLTIDKVFLDSQECIQSEFDLDRKSRHPVDGCLVAIASFCDCKTWFSKGYGKPDATYYRPSRYCFFGLPTDIEMAKYLLGMIMQAMDTETETFKGTSSYVNAVQHRKSLTVSFQHGMANRISNRLTEMTHKRHADESENPITVVEDGVSTITSIVLVKKNKIQDDFEKLGMKLRTNYSSRRISNGDAYCKGSAAGDRVSLTRPISAKIAGQLT